MKITATRRGYSRFFRSAQELGWLNIISLRVTKSRRAASLTDTGSRINYSCMSLTSIQEEIVRLSSDERAKLIDILWESLDEERVAEIEAKWAAESEERIDAVDRGELQTIDGPSALRDLRSSLRKCYRKRYLYCRLTLPWPEWI
jgi:putative addiction module component (TIGR02574 family)